MDINWDKVKGAIGTIAPWIAGTLGTPVAGMATKAVCEALGLNSNATPDNVMAAIAGATPSELLALKQADLAHQEVMLKLGYDHIDKVTEMDVTDRNGARAREIAVRDGTPSTLACVVIGGFLGISLLQLVAVMFFPIQAAAIPAQGWLLIGNISGYLAGEAKQAGAYYFGSSSSSERKTELLAQSPAITK